MLPDHLNKTLGYYTVINTVIKKSKKSDRNRPFFLDEKKIMKKSS